MLKRVSIKLKYNNDESQSGKIVIKQGFKKKIEFGIRQRILCVRFHEPITENNPIVITKKESKVLFNNLNWFLDQQYTDKSNDLEKQYKDNSRFEYLSDVRSHLGDVGTPRIVIEREKDSISISERIPVLKERINISGGQVVFDVRNSILEEHNSKTDKSIKPDFFESVKCSMCKCFLYRNKRR